MSAHRELCTSHGEKGYPAEDVADDAIDDLVDYLELGAPVGSHLADQLLLPMAIAGAVRQLMRPAIAIGKQQLIGEARTAGAPSSR